MQLHPLLYLLNANQGNLCLLVLCFACCVQLVEDLARAQHHALYTRLHRRLGSAALGQDALGTHSMLSTPCPVPTRVHHKYCN
jgi:hypothetical protein